MSAVYKVMEQMQRTRQRRLRGNREVMIVLGCIIIVGMLILVGTLNKRLKADNQLAAASPTSVMTGTAGDRLSLDGKALIITVTLNEQNQWVVADQGVVTPEELSGIFAAKRSEADEQEMRVIVRAQISGDQPARHFMELHRLAEDRKLDQVNVVTHEPLLEDEGT